jgi:hypothetical protein
MKNFMLNWNQSSFAFSLPTRHRMMEHRKKQSEKDNFRERNDQQLLYPLDSF